MAPKPKGGDTSVATTVNLVDSISEGTVLAGRYRVLAPLGEGGMGAVYRVAHVHIPKVFALKVLHANLSSHPGIAERFEREAIAAARIEHPNVVPATDFGRLPDGSFFLVLEFVDGRSLRSELDARAMPAPRALQIMRGVVAGVRAAHEKGIIHRDLKPENIMLVERDGNRDFVKLLDFGIARMESPEKPKGAQPLTVAGTVLGTPAYMSPEQVLGHSCDGRSDLYSVGIIFFELLTGSCPFVGNIAELLHQQVVSEPPPLPPAVATAHPGLAEIVRVLLAKSPKERFQTAAELARALDEPSLQGPETGSGLEAPPVRERGADSRSFIHALQQVGRRVSPRRLASSAGAVVKGAGARVRGFFGGRADRGRWLERQDRRNTQPLRRTALATRQLTRQMVRSVAKPASSVLAGLSSGVARALRSLRRTARTVVVALCCAAALLLIAFLVATRGRSLLALVGLGGTQHSNRDAAARVGRTSGVDVRPPGTASAARARPPPASSSPSAQPSDPQRHIPPVTWRK